MSNKKVIKIVTALMLYSALVFNGSAQQVVSETGKLDASASQELQDFKRKIQAANPGMDVVSVEADVVKRAVLAPRPAPPANPKVAIFVKNQTRVPGMDDEVDGVRDRIGAELAGAGMIIMDQAEIAGGFNRFKVTTAEERAGLVDGVFTGGSTVRVAQMLGCDYIMLVNIIRASTAQRTAGGKPVTIFTLNMTTKVNEAVQGSSVYGSSWSQKLPVPGDAAAADDPMNYYNDLIDQWSTQTGEEIAAKAPTWRRADATLENMVSFSVSTTVDELIKGLESGVRAPNELLDEMRHVVGGVTVELDGATLGSSPGTFQATPGLHQLRITRQWMTPWQKTVNIQEGANFSVGLELSDAGINRYQSMEGFRSLVAFTYAEAVMRKGVKVNFDTAAWRDVSIGDKKGGDVNVGVGTTVVR
ncbi:MAG: PEGA domain-containing protein [Kiritimatiellae bacterium]|nr:PEGA domain-containing protein [Kiritimatiellia bacterium]